MHLRLSSTYGSRMALVGHASMHLVQDPQRSGAGESVSRTKSVRMQPRNSHDPAFSLMMQVFFPNHPIPAYFAKTRSFTGPVSTYVRVWESVCDSIHRASSSSLRLIVSW